MRLAQIVRDEEDRQPVLAAQPQQLRAQVPAQRLVQGRERFVDQQHLRGANERARQRHALLLTARQLMRSAAVETFDREQLPQRRPTVAGLGVALHADQDVVQHVHVWEERRVLDHIADAPPLRSEVDAAVRVEDGATADRDVTVRRPQ